MSSVDPHATIRDDHPQGQVAWWESTPSEGRIDAPRPAWTSEGYGALLARNGRALGGEQDGPRYAVDGLLGHGSGGTVWSVHDQRLDRPVAIKVLARTGGDSLRALRNFLGEARIAASLRHPNVLAIHDLDVTTSGDACFVMQRIEGISLGDLLRARNRGEVPEPISDINAIVNIFTAVGQALAYAHHHGVVHQDVKPDNILIGRFGEVILVDWGCATRSKGAAGRLTGTPIYMSPEQARCEGADARSDVYCLGASFFHALAGRPPLPPGEDPAAFWEGKRRGDIVPLDQAEQRRISAPLLAIALRSMAADVTQRYQSADAMVSDLRNYQAGLAVDAYHDGLFSLLRRWYRLNRVPIGITAIAVLLLLGAFGLYLDEKSRARSAWQVAIQDDLREMAQSAAHWRVRIGKTREDKPPLIELPSAQEHGALVMKDGHLTLGRSGNSWINLVTAESFSGDLRVEWTAQAPETPQNLNVFLGEDRFSGYTLHIGGYADSASCYLTWGMSNAALHQARLPRPIVTGQPMPMRLEREDTRLRFWFDDTLVLDYSDLEGDSLTAPTRFGFDAFKGNLHQVDRVVISTRPLPERISPLAVGQTFAQVGEHQRAGDVFAGLAKAHAGKPLAIDATFRAALAYLRAGNDPQAGPALEAVARAHPDHDLAPYAWIALVEFHEAAENQVDRDRARDALRAYPGHALQQRVLQGIGLQRLKSIGGWLTNTEKPETIQMCVDVAEEIQYWRKRYQLVPDGNSCFDRVAKVCFRHGRSDLVTLSLPPTHKFFGEVYFEAGDYDRALAGWQQVIGLPERIREARGQPPLAGPGLAEQPRMLVWKGDREAAAAAEWWDTWAEISLAQGRFPEVLAEKRCSYRWRQTAALFLGLWQEVLDLVESDPANSHGIFAEACLGNLDEALARNPWHGLHAPAVALEHWRQGRMDRARSIYRDLRERVPDHTDSTQVISWWLWQLPVLLLEDGGRDIASELLERVATRRTCNGQRSAHVADFILGRINEIAFRAQPRKSDLDLDLLQAQALRAEWLGQREDARAVWRTIALEAPPVSTDRFVLRRFAEWMAQQ